MNECVASAGLVIDDLHGSEPALPMAIGMRGSTRFVRQEAVARVVDAMRDRVAEPLSLDEMARVAMFSPYHFHRVFRLVTGVPPARFLTSLRMSEACRLLITTQMRVTDVCFEVGFGSLGTFTTRFGRLVGAPPQHLRALASRYARRSLAELADERDESDHAQPGSVGGWVDTPLGEECVAMLGLFSGEFPHGLPIACSVVRAPGPFSFGAVPDGSYVALAVGFPLGIGVVDAVLIGPCDLLVGTRANPTVRRARDRANPIHLRLRRGSLVDPPIVLAAPLLLAEQTDAARRAAHGPRQAIAYA